MYLISTKECKCWIVTDLLNIYRQIQCMQDFVAPLAVTGRKNRALQVPSVVLTKPLETFLRLCMGKREELAVHGFAVLSQCWFYSTQ